MEETLTVVDNRTNTTYTFPLFKGCVRTMDLRKIKTSADDFGVMGYDPAFMNTASCQSSITYIDGDKGILRYRGYPIEELAENCSFLEVAHLLLRYELPNEEQLKGWTREVMEHAFVPENIKKLIDGFHYDAHPMGMLISTVAALSTFYPDSRNVRDPEVRKMQMRRLLGKLPTLAAYSYRYRRGLPYADPDPDLGFAENFMAMLWKQPGKEYKPNPVLARALDVLFILHADHEQNCSANAMRAVGSSQADPFVSTAAAAAALSGPLHGGANEEVLRMLDEIGTKDHVPAYVQSCKDGHKRLMGFGHRVYKNYDPRAKIIKRIADQVFEVTGKNKKIEIALELEKIALEDEYFVKRKLYPNVDFYSGIIYEALGFEPVMFTVLFALPRMAGWLAQWAEMLEDPEQKIARPRQIYTGVWERHLTPKRQTA
jgi:citrate synthase